VPTDGWKFLSKLLQILTWLSAAVVAFWVVQLLTNRDQPEWFAFLGPAIAVVFIASWIGQDEADFRSRRNS